MMKVPGFEIVEVIHESRPRIILRAIREADGQTVVLKTLADKYPTRRDVAEMSREFGIARLLRSIDGVIQVDALVQHGEGNLAIVMELFGQSLADLLVQRQRQGLPLADFLPLAVRIARILGRVHERGIVHKDVVPKNILVRDSDIRVIDFGLSSELSLERQGLAIPKRLEGTLPYISPEQTGRMNRAVDFRSDYYSLGVSYFVLLTGELPFSADSVLTWIHQHLTKLPPSPRSIDPTIPEAVARIVLKLMSKNAEDRYQSTYGLIADLTRCQEQLAGPGSIADFELGQDDVPRSFQIPQKLYGRDEELALLREAFDVVAAGGTELCMVSGYSGVGKSALVNELANAVARESGYLAQGKFEEFRRGSAYSAISQAFRGLTRQLLAEPRDRLDEWRQAISRAFGPNGQVLLDLVPELGLIVGVQPPVPELAPTEAQNRLQLVFVDFVKAFATSAHPLVIFIDDLQWSDAPTLSLIEHLVTARDLRHLFVIGAYRSNEVDAAHPLQLILDDIRKARSLVELPIRSLDIAAMAQLTADTLHCHESRSRPISELLHEKSRGNPFFLKELLKRLHDDGSIAFCPETGRWTWDSEAVRRAEVSDNVVEFMVASLRRLPEATQRALRLAACIGSVFDLATLAIINEQSRPATAAALFDALKRHLVIPLDESYKFTTSVEANPSYKFQHDRVQEAAYELIDTDRKHAVHLSIGRLIQAHSSEEERAERLFDIVGHLDIGRKLIVDPAERRALAQLNLTAGIKAHGASAYASALSFLRVAHELLPADAWEGDYSLMMAISSEYQQNAYLTGMSDEAETWIETMLERAQSALEKAEILSTRTRQYSTTGKMRESIDAAIEGLSLLGIAISANPDKSAIDAEIADVTRYLGEREIADLIDAAPLSDPRSRIAIRLLMEIFPAAFLSGSGNLFPFLVLRSVNISLRDGTGPESAFAYAAYGMLLCGSLDNPALGYEYGKLAVAMNEQLDDVKLKSRVIYVYAMFVHHWSNHWSTMTPWFKKGIEAGYQSGDLLYLAYSAQDCIIWDPTLDLEAAAREQRKYLRIVRDCEYQDSLDSGTLFLQMQLNFRGQTSSLYSMTDDDFDEEVCVAGMLERRFMTGYANFLIYKAEIHYLYDDYAKAYEYVLEQDELIASAMSLPQIVRFYLVAFLTRAARYADLDGADQQRTLARLDADLRQMSRWSENCPDNYAHLVLIMRAELARLAGQTETALDLFDDATVAARKSRFRRDEALANELPGKLLLAAGRPKAAEGYLRAAHYLYYRWGAQRKVTHMEERYPDLLRMSAVAGRSTTLRSLRESSSLSSSAEEHAAIDMDSVMKASQAISGEIRLGQLWKTTIELLLENAGGQRGWFVLREDRRLFIRARAEAGADLAPLAEPVPVVAEGEDAALPISVINSALRTGEPLVLNNAVEASWFADDPYIVAHQPKSIICIPIHRHGKFDGAIYMENTLTIGAFTQDRVEVIKLLSAQASISMENARLYDEQVRLIEAQQRFVPSQFLESLGHPDIARVGLGEHVAKEMSVMFSDIRGFTTRAERLSPGAVIELLNRYFSNQSQPIARAGGFIDAFTGDEIMALFDVSPDAAVRAGVEMHRALEELNRQLVAEGGEALEVGMGMVTGALVLGTVGGQDRLKCGVVGDVVNLASRIEQLTKVYKAPFLIGDGTVDKLAGPDRFSIRMVDRVAVKGKHHAVSLYEVLDAEAPARREAKETTRGLLKIALDRYLERDFATACLAVGEALTIDPEDPVLAILAARAERYLRRPPPADWQGFEILQHK